PLVRVVECSPAGVNADVLTFDPPELQESLPECVQVVLKFRVVLLVRHQHANTPHALAHLGTRGKRPCRRRAAEQTDEIAPLHCRARPLNEGWSVPRIALPTPAASAPAAGPQAHNKAR